MATRAESAAATREALVHAASELLDAGGPAAVTLREVGARAGVSRGAPYGHFRDKEHLLTSLAVDAWNRTADRAAHLPADADASPPARLKAAVLILIEVARDRPHLYELMFNASVTEPIASEAASRLERLYLGMVADLVGESEAHTIGALLMSSAYGIAWMEGSGHLKKEQWHADAAQLVDALVDAIGR